MMIGPVIGIGGIFCILIASELLWRTKFVHHAETSRKFVHILTGVFVAFWPFFMSFGYIQLLSVAMLLVVLVSKHLHIFKSIHGVGRQTFGELLFPAGIFIAATFAQSDWIYAAAVLHLSLADGLAAVVGVRHLKRFSYRMFGQTKTVVGTFAFYLVSLAITLAVVVFDVDSYGSMGQAIVFWLPISTTLLENVATYGTDNLVIPLFVVVMLNSLQTAV